VKLRWVIIHQLWRSGFNVGCWRCKFFEISSTTSYTYLIVVLIKLAFFLDIIFIYKKGTNVVKGQQEVSDIIGS
jgi:hypothetical protein